MSAAAMTPTTTKPLRVVIDCRLRSGVAGGIESVILGLAGGLSRLRDGDEEYILLAYPNAHEWVALVTDEWDQPPANGGLLVLRFSDTMWLHTLASLAWERALPL